jgi:5'-3' exonuclease
LVEVNECEADDIIAVLARQSNSKVMIISRDFDMFQLLSQNISIYNPIDKKLIIWKENE